MQRLPATVQPDAGGKDFIESLNPNSLKVITAKVEPSLANALPGQNFQFERHGYFVADRVDHVAGIKPVFNLAVGLKDSWGKLQHTDKNWSDVNNHHYFELTTMKSGSMQ